MEEKETASDPNLTPSSAIIWGFRGSAGGNGECDKKNIKGYGYHYTDFDQLLNEVKPLPGKYHFAVVWELTTFQKWLAMPCKVLWKDGSCAAQSTCPLLVIQEQPVDDQSSDQRVIFFINVD
jgi:hypothetical protein